MKLVAIFLALATGAALAADPGAAAIDFLKKIREGNLNLEPGGDTALTAQTAESKRREISRRLDRMMNDLKSGTLEVGAVKQDENLAAVLVRKVGGFDPASLQVFPVALVKRGSHWTAAPVPASFENAGVGYGQGIRQRLEALERWMLREQVLDLAKLRDQSAARMRAEIEKQLPRATYRELDHEEVGRGFIRACAQGDQAAMLGYLGGIRESLPHDWSLRLKAIDEAVAAGPQAPRPWRLLMSPEVVRVIVHEEAGGDTALVSVACLDPAEGERRRLPRIRLVHLDMDKNREGLWKVNLPGEFLRTETLGEDEEEEAGAMFDSELLEAFPANLRSEHPATPRAEAREAFDATLEAMKAPDLLPLLSLVEIGDDSAAALRACGRAAQSWWPVRDSSGLRYPLPLSFREEGDAAVGIVQFLALAEPDRTRLRTFHYRKSANGWLWRADLSADATGSDTDSELHKWTAQELARWKSGWQKELFPDPVTAAELAAGSAPTAEQARATATEWLAALRAGDLTAALSRICLFDSPASPSKALRNLNFEVGSVALATRGPEIVAVAEGTFWTLVLARIDQEKGPIFPVYPVITTAEGPRVLLEIDLFAAARRTRSWLNSESMRLAGRLVSQEAAAELRKLFLEVEKQAAPAKN